jgi:hypothetical protein
MTEQVQEALAEVDSAPAPEVTATTEPAQTLPADVENQAQEQTAEERKFTQAELDSIIDKRFAKERRKWEREQQARLAEMQVKQAVPKEVPPVDQFESPEAYAEALAVKKAEELIALREQQKAQAAIVDAYHEREEEARGKYDDFEQVAYNPNLRITEVMAETIRASDVGPDVAYYLGANPKEADRISRLSPFLQAKEIGKIEVKLSDNPPIRKTSSAPAPITPVTARASGNSSYDTTDPRSVKTMSTSEWIEADRQRQMKKLQAQYNR